MVALFLGVLVLLHRPTPTATLADGRKVTIERVTYGADHRFTVGKWWVRMLKPILGNKWAARRDCYELRFTNAFPTLMVWTSWKQPSYTNSLPLEAMIDAEQGVESRSELVVSRWNDGSPWMPLPESHEPNARVAWLFPNFPRRSETLRLRLYDRDERNVLTQAVEIAFSNPTPQRFPKWTGTPLPVTKENAGVEFVLTNVRPVSNALWRLEFLVRTNGQPDFSWRVGEVTASSASGNLLSTISNLASLPATNLVFNLRGALWPEEPVWRFAAEFCRATDFQPDELWIASDIAVPSRGAPFQITTNVGSHRARVIVFKLESVPQTVPYHPGGLRRNANIHLRFKSGQERLFLVKVTDDQGRAVKTELGFVTSDGLHDFGLLIPRDAKSLNFTFAIRKSRMVEFNVSTPSLLPTNNDPGRTR